MNLLIIGSGGREHALAWKLKQSARVSQIFCAPGNAGTAQLGENVAIAPMDFPALIAFAKDHAIGLTLVGPDDPLAAGIVDAFQAAGLRVFGPSAAAARLEASKSFAKEFMVRHGIPTAASRTYDDPAEAREFCATQDYPLVVKADGLALGKGVLIAQTRSEAEDAIRQCMEDAVFGDAGRRIVIEEFLVGRECSIHALVDSSGYCLFPDARDHKRAFDGDLGPNTGGMGTLSPSGVLDADLLARVRTEILDRFVAGIRAESLIFQGMLFPGLMVTADGLRVLEFNCRFGDPETQSLVRRLDSDLLDLLEATVENRIASASPQWSDQAAACIVLASGGYPAKYESGKLIAGLDDAAAEGAVVFHAGTRVSEHGILTAGGRVLGVTSLGPDYSAAARSAYHAAGKICFDKMQFRQDIGRGTAR